jgi:hypothetical protein
MKNVRTKKSTQKSEIGPNIADKRAQDPTSITKQPKPKAKRPCRNGASCHNAKCAFLHPQDESEVPSAPVVGGTTNAAVKSIEDEASKNNMREAMWHIDLEESMVANALRSESNQKLSENARQRKRRQGEDAELHRLKKEEEELRFLLQEKGQQRSAEAEEEHQKIQEKCSKGEDVRLQQQETKQRKRAAKMVEQGARHPVVGKRTRQERRCHQQEDLERRTRAFDAVTKKEEDARLRAAKDQEEELLHYAKLKAEQEKVLEEEKCDLFRLEERRKVQQKRLIKEEERFRLVEEERRFKEERKAAKKERRKREKESNNDELARKRSEEALRSSPTNSNRDVQNLTNSNQETIDCSGTPQHGSDNPSKSRSEEAARSRRLQEELRLRKTGAAEKKEQKQKLRRKRFLEDLEHQSQERTEFWRKEIANEKRAVEIVVQLCVAEFCRKNPTVARLEVLCDPEAKAKLEEIAQQTYRIICKADIHGRFTVKGFKQQDLNDRTGTIERWDEIKGKFYVALDSKKGKNLQYMYLPPGNLEALADESARRNKKKGDPVHVVLIAVLYKGKNLITDIYKSEVDALKESSCLDDYLISLMKERDIDERFAKEQEEEEFRQEEEARRRRMEQRRREDEEWWERKREYEAQKEKYQDWRRGERREHKSRTAHANSGCGCPQCQFERKLFGNMRGGNRGMGGIPGGLPGFFFAFGGGFSFRFDDDEGDCDDSDYEDEWDRQWNHKHEKEEAVKNEEAADVLGVEVDATPADIKRVYRKKALKYHPDKYRAENHGDGMTKDEAEEHFKEMTSAYDHLMSNFDDN